MPKLQPAVMTMNYQLNTAAAGAFAADTIDFSQSASALNRRFYRAGLNWAVSHFTLHTAGTGSVSISKIPDTWVAASAWMKAFSAWNKQQKDALKEAGGLSAAAKFRDFKVYLDEYHHEQGFGNNLVPFNYDTGITPLNPAPTPITLGEWEASMIVVPNILPDGTGSTVDPIEYDLMMVGANTSANAGASTKYARGIIEGYADSRAFPQSPDPVSPALDSDDNWLRSMFNVGNDSSEIVDNAIDRNDELPYDQVNYPNGQTNGVGLQLVTLQAVTTSTVGGRTVLPGTNFPCGLVRIINTSSAGWTSPPLIQVHLVPGSHRGYLAEPMQDM